MSLSGKIIMLDPGHGGESPSGSICADYNYGTAGALSGDEKDSVLSIAFKLKTLLEQNGASVYMTRQSDRAICLPSRSYAANVLNPDAFISLHHNGGDSSVSGISAHYYKNIDKRLAQCLYPEIQSATRLNLYRNGLVYQNLHVCREVNAPSCLVELGFMSNSNDDNFISTDVGKAKFAIGIVNGLKAYF